MDVARWLEKVQLAATGKMADEPAPKAAAGPCHRLRALAPPRARMARAATQRAPRKRRRLHACATASRPASGASASAARTTMICASARWLDNSAELVRQCGPYGHLGYLPRGKGSGAC